MNDKEWQDLAEEGLLELIKGAKVTKEHIDKDGYIHELNAKLPPNIDAIKFALKNRSNGKWADKTEITHTQVNLNLTTSYNEIKELMNKEKGKSLPVIDAEVISEEKEDV